MLFHLSYFKKTIEKTPLEMTAEVDHKGKHLGQDKAITCYEERLNAQKNIRLWWNSTRFIPHLMLNSIFAQTLPWRSESNTNQSVFIPFLPKSCCTVVSHPFPLSLPSMSYCSYLSTYLISLGPDQQITHDSRLSKSPRNKCLLDQALRLSASQSRDCALLFTCRIVCTPSVLYT